MSTITQPTPPVILPEPPLQAGDHLTVAEFRRRYEAMPGIKAELIRGVVFIPSPVTADFHGFPHADLIGWLGYYRAHTPGIRVSDNATVREIDQTSEPQPDIAARILTEFGGRSRINIDGYIEGSPELIAEVAASSASYDLHDKLDLYRTGGVREYLVWRVYDSAFDWFVLRGSQYDPLVVQPSGFHQSEVFPGLWLDAPALMSGDLARVLQVAQLGLASPEHAAFVQRLQQARRPTP